MKLGLGWNKGQSEIRVRVELRLGLGCNLGQCDLLKFNLVLHRLRL